MKRIFGVRQMMLLASGAMLMQGIGCSFVEINEFVQTVFLGVTAAGSVAILQNV